MRTIKKWGFRSAPLSLQIAGLLYSLLGADSNSLLKRSWNASSCGKFDFSSWKSSITLIHEIAASERQVGAERLSNHIFP